MQTATASITTRPRVVKAAEQSSAVADLVHVVSALEAVVGETRDADALRQLGSYYWILCQRSGGLACACVGRSQASCDANGRCQLIS